MRIYAHAKINLYLHVVGKKENGMHLLRTVIQPVELCDVLDIEVIDEGSGEVRFWCDVAWLCHDDNLVVRTCREFAARTGLCFDADIKLKKVIPSSAGLGGGSADAAAVLCYLNEYFGAPLNEDELAELGYKIGWDVPPLIMGGRVLVEESGLPALVCLPRLPQTNVVIVKPPFSVDTAAAFARFDEMNDADLECTNHLECASGYGDEIAELKGKLLSFGASSAEMSGSGSAVFGLFDDKAAAEEAAERMRDEGEVFLTRYLNNG